MPILAEGLKRRCEEENRTEIILRMNSLGYPVSEIAAIASLSEDEVREILKKNGVEPAEENTLDSFFSKNKPKGMHQFGKD